MAEWYEKIDRIISLAVAVGTALLAGAIIWEAASREFLLTVALVVAILSWTDAVVDLGKKSEEHYNAADEYHDLYEDFKDFHNLQLTGTYDSSVMSEKFEKLIDQRRTIKRSSPRTTNFWYNRLDHDELSNSIEKELEENRATV